MYDDMQGVGSQRDEALLSLRSKLDGEWPGQVSCSKAECSDVRDAQLSDHEGVQAEATGGHELSEDNALAAEEEPLSSTSRKAGQAE